MVAGGTGQVVGASGRVQSEAGDTITTKLRPVMTTWLPSGVLCGAS